MSDAVKKQAEGVCTEISEKNDWTTFHIDVGRQYPLRVSTKLEALIKQGREAKGQKAVWTFSESEGGENPNKPGTHYINRRLEKVEVGGSLDPSISPAASAGGGGGSTAGGRGPDERHSIERQTIIKACIPIYDKFADDDAFFSFLERCAKFTSGGSAPVAAAPQPEPTPAPPAAEQSEEGDDIPF